jgi:hypothetical protein
MNNVTKVSKRRVRIVVELRHFVTEMRIEEYQRSKVEVFYSNQTKKITTVW